MFPTTLPREHASYAHRTVRFTHPAKDTNTQVANRLHAPAERTW